MHLGNERARGVDGGHLPAGGFVPDAGADSVGREHDVGAVGDLIEVFHEHCSGRLQPGDHMRVVDDLAAYVYRRAVALEGALDRLDRSPDAGAKRTRLG